MSDYRFSRAELDVFFQACDKISDYGQARIPLSSLRDIFGLDAGDASRVVDAYWLLRHPDMTAHFHRHV